MMLECFEYLVYFYWWGLDLVVFFLDFRFLKGGMGLFLYLEIDILYGFDKIFCLI